jgi:hypothetical protein
MATSSAGPFGAEVVAHDSSLQSRAFRNKDPSIALAFDYFLPGPECHLWIEPSPFAAFLGAVLPTTVLIEARGRVEEARRQIDAK